MDFLKKLFAVGGNSGDTGAYYYVRPKHCDEIVQVRVNLLSESSLTDDGGYFVRKMVRGRRCPFPAELHIHMDRNHKIRKVEVVDGEQATREEYDAWLETKQSG